MSMHVINVLCLVPFHSTSIPEAVTWLLLLINFETLRSGTNVSEPKVYVYNSSYNDRVCMRSKSKYEFKILHPIKLRKLNIMYKDEDP